MLVLLMAVVTGAWAQDASTVFELSGSTASVGTLVLGTNVSASQVKIHNDHDNINCIKLGGTYSYANGKYFTIAPASGSFKKGDKVSIAVCCNHTYTSESVAKAVIYAADGSTLLYTTSQGINGSNSAGDPVVEEFELTQDAEKLYIGRLGKQGDAEPVSTYVTTLKVTGARAQDPTYIVAGNNSDIFGSVWDGSYEANKMTKGGDGKYTKTYNVGDAIDDIQLKVVKDNQEWFGDETGYNVTFSMKQAGSFTVTIDPNANPVYVTVTGSNVVLANTEYAINYATGMQNGTVTGPATAKENDEVTLTITPATGYVLESISVTGVTTENAVEVTDGKFTMPAEDVNVIATFKLVTYAITLAEGTEDFDNWTIEPTEAAEGETVTATYTGTKRVKNVKAVKK